MLHTVCLPGLIDHAKYLHPYHMQWLLTADDVLHREREGEKAQTCDTDATTVNATVHMCEHMFADRQIGLSPFLVAGR